MLCGTEAFVGGLPGGNYILKTLARIDLIFWPPDLSQKDLVQEEQEELAREELGQEDTTQDAEGNLAQEEYFREILRGYSPEARRRLRQLNITGDPSSVLDRNRHGDPQPSSLFKVIVPLPFIVNV